MINPERRLLTAVVVLLAWASTSAPTMADAPVRFFCSFDAGLSADQAAGRADPVASTGTDFAAAGAGRALHLAGATGPANVVYQAAGNFPVEAGTIEFRVRLDWDFKDSTSRAKRTWIDIGSSGNHDRYYLQSLGTGMVFGIFDSSGTVHAVYGTANMTWQKGEWHSVTLTWDLARQYMALALDGNLQSDKPIHAHQGNWSVATDAVEAIRIGGWGNAPLPLGGDLDDFTIRSEPTQLAVPAASRPEVDEDQLRAAQRDAAEALARLEKSIRVAQRERIDVSYADAVAEAARIGLWRLTRSPVKPTPADRRSWCAYVTRRCPEAEANLTALLRDRTWEKRVPTRDMLGLHPAGDSLRNRDGEDVLLVGVRNTIPAEFDELRRFFNLICWNSGAPDDWIRRVQHSGYAGQVHLFWSEPVQAALAEHPDMRNVEGWCGHNWATGLCIDAPRSRAVIANVVARLRVLQRPADPSIAYTVLSAEDEYMCWCDTSIALFRKWLAARYAGIDRLNRSWGTAADTFAELSPPHLRRAGITPDNRAAWYDWQQFNRARTTEFYGGLKSIAERAWPQVPVCGGTHLHLADNRWGSQGVDPEGLNRGINDVIQCETMYGLPTRAFAHDAPPYGL
ncbi:MAG TPA: beta-galactosidase, partial [Phycisphaerae bacterium]|nr:beta-galactosidase [Phycisphaerae bacterium]